MTFNILSLPKVDWDVEFTSDGVVTLNFYGAEAGASWELAGMTDVHFDNKKCRRDLYFKHLQYCKDRNVPIFDASDWFCAMQGKWDKRKSEDAMRDEYRGGQYFDKLVNVGAEYLEPYAKQFAMMGMGNHETAILAHHETDLTERLVTKMNAMGSPIIKGRYFTWLRCRFWFNKNCYVTKIILVHHGFGGGGRVTRGTLDINHLGIHNPDADIIYVGHVHHDYEVAVERLRVSRKGIQYKDTQLHLRAAGYKDEMSCGVGWAVEKGMAPRTQGCRIITFEVTDPSDKKIGFTSRRLL